MRACRGTQRKRERRILFSAAFFACLVVKIGGIPFRSYSVRSTREPLKLPQKVAKSTEILRISVLFMVEISGIEPLTVSALRAETPPAAATIEMQEVSGSPVSCQAKKTATFR